MAQKPWEHAKSAGSEEDALAARFVESLSYDTRLYKHDIAGSIAHARMLQHVKLITADELAAIERGLGEIENEIEAANITEWAGWKVELEDVHMCIEAALIEKIGDPGRKLHTGRSRNDQVAMDLELWVANASEHVTKWLRDLQNALMELADRDGDIVIPSYTHLQRAQPIVAGGELVAWRNAFAECEERIGRLSYWFHNPLGSGAIAGSSLPLDRRLTTYYMLGMRLDGDNPTPSMYTASPDQIEGLDDLIEPHLTTSSIYSTASRDVALDFVYALSMTSMWLSRWAEQWIIYMTAEFGMLQIGDAYTTGSSMMPQKRNPDMLELIRGRCGGVYGHLVALLTICKGLTIGYNRDLQEDKRHVFAAYDTVRDCLQMAAGIVRSAKFKSPDMTRGYMDATSLAEYLVTKGVPFRTAHQHVGALVRHCMSHNITQLSDLSVADMNRIASCDAIADDVYDWLGADNVVKRYQTYGNAGLSGYRQQLAEWKKRLGDSPDTHGAARLSGPHQPAPATPTDSNLFNDPGISVPDSDASLISAYVAAGRTLDDLPYTDEFERVYEAVGGSLGLDRAALLHRLLTLRKAGKLPKLGRAAEKAPIVTADHEAILAELVCAKVANLSARDRLPHTPDFADVVDGFNARTGLSFSPYQVWRVVAKLAK